MYMEKVFLLLPDNWENQPQNDCKVIQLLIDDFVEDYERNQDKPVEEWLSEKMQKELPERSSQEISEMAREIIESLHCYEDKKTSLEASLKEGRSKESWFAKEVKNATSAASTLETQYYLYSLDEAVLEANEFLRGTITTRAGAVSQNPCLDGFIAEQYHAQTFNMNAEASGSQYRARVLEPNGGTYHKNSVDIVIEDGNGNVVRRYQSKYCKDAAATEQAFHEGDYRGQQSLVPSDQKPEINRKCTDRLEAPDGTKSNPLTKNRAEQMRDEAQSGNWQDLNWNEYKTLDLAKGIGKKAGAAALMGVAIGAGTEIASKLIKGEKIEVKEVAKNALEGGVDFGVKAAAAGAIKVGAEKGILKMIPKGTPAATIANVVFVGVEDAKILYKMAKGELSGQEGLQQIETTTVSAACGLACMAKGASVGASLGLALGPVGTVVGGFVGGTIGYIAGSTIGKEIVEVSRKVRKIAFQAVKSLAREVATGVKSIFRKIENLFLDVILMH